MLRGSLALNQATSDYRQVLNDPAVNTVFVLGGHNTHARFVCEALQAGKHVYVEKPLAMNEEELNQIDLRIADN